MFLDDTAEVFAEARRLPRKMAGAELNVALGARRLEHSVGYITQLGDDWQGNAIRDFMAEQGIDTSHILTAEQASTGFQVKVILADGESRVVYFREGSAASKMSARSLFSLHLGDFKILHITGIFPALSDGNYDLAQGLIEAAHQRGSLVTFDPNPRPTLWKSQEEMIAATNRLAFVSDIVMPGHSEGVLFTGRSDPQDIASFYLDKGVSKVIIKLGESGSALFEHDEHGHISRTVMPSFIVKTVDVIGAGDGFASGILTGLLEGFDNERLLERANAIGALQVTNLSDNEGLPTRQQLEAFIRDTPRKDISL
jgi:2-dehydro-3-deoxygluconokinase